MSHSTTTEIKNLIFTTDIHLNMVHENALASFCDKINAQGRTTPSAVVISGDISESPTFMAHFDHFQSKVDKDIPIYFVLGNHDYYDGSINQTRATVNAKYGSFKNENNRIYLSGVNKPVFLNESTALIGRDGWYDGLYSEFRYSKLNMSDFFVIRDFDNSMISIQERWQKFRDLARHDAEDIKIIAYNLFEQNQKCDNLVIVTHVPPFRENSTYAGVISDHHWMPYFSSKHMGDAIVEIAHKYPEKNILVLCGHSHGYAKHVVSGYNVVCITGKARYRKPTIAKTFNLNEVFPLYYSSI